MGKAFQPHDLYGIIGACLILVLAYLLLTHYGGATGILNSLFTGANQTFTTLQGR